ncbi:MAG: hypothetical protein JNL63_10025 [Bacteroidia bacterium]|nr:hypothetical protein [Bacteroidia bacterium]
MNIITIPYNENYRLNIVGAISLTLTFLFISFFSVYFLIGLILPVIILANRKGLQIDIVQNQYREYHKIFRRTKGDWKSLEPYKKIVVLSKTVSKTATGTLMTSDIRIKGLIHIVYLIDESHLKKLYLKSFDHHDQANDFAKKMAKNIGFPIVEFSPKAVRHQTGIKY